MEFSIKTLFLIRRTKIYKIYSNNFINVIFEHKIKTKGATRSQCRTSIHPFTLFSKLFYIYAVFMTEE